MKLAHAVHSDTSGLGALMSGKGHQHRFCRFADMSVIRRIANSVRESSNARQDNADLGELAGLRIDLYRPAVLLDDNVVTNG
jgi:hypothetical protein